MSGEFPHPRRARSFGRPETPFDPRTGTYLPIGYPAWLVPFTITEIGHGALLCTDSGGLPVRIAKPWPFRKSEFDGEEIGPTADPTTYTSTALDARTSSNTADGFNVEDLDPPYLVGETILATKRPDGLNVVVEAGEFSAIDAGTYEVIWEDVNIAGRRWVKRTDSRALLVTNRTTGNLLDCSLIDKDGAVLGAIVVARRSELQKDYFHNETIDSVAYVFVSETARTADGDTENIVPSYVASKTEVLVRYLPGGTGLTDPLTGEDVNWQEVSFRGWGTA